MRGARLERFKFAIYVISASLCCCCQRLASTASRIARHRRASFLSATASAGNCRVRLQPALGARIHFRQRACARVIFALSPASRRSRPPFSLAVLCARVVVGRCNRHPLLSPRAAAVHSRQGRRARGHCGRSCRISAQARRRGGCCRRNRTGAASAAAPIVRTRREDRRANERAYAGTGATSAQQHR